MREQPAARQHLLRAQLCQGEGHSWPLAHAGPAAAWAFAHIPRVNRFREALSVESLRGSGALSRCHNSDPHPGPHRLGSSERIQYPVWAASPRAEANSMANGSESTLS